MRDLLVWKQGIRLPWCRVELDRVRNDWLLLELVRHCCPRDLLVPNDR